MATVQIFIPDVIIIILLNIIIKQRVRVAVHTVPWLIRAVSRLAMQCAGVGWVHSTTGQGTRVVARSVRGFLLQAESEKGKS